MSVDELLGQELELSVERSRGQTPGSQAEDLPLLRCRALGESL